MKLEPLLRKKAKEKQGIRNDIPQKSGESSTLQREIENIHATPGISWDQKIMLADSARLESGKETRRRNMSESMQVYVAVTVTKIKIGISSDPQGRIEQLRTSDPDIKLVTSYPGGKEIESDLLKKFAEKSIGGEWFSKTENLVSEICAYLKRKSKRENETVVELARVAHVSHDTIATPLPSITTTASNVSG